MLLLQLLLLRRLLLHRSMLTIAKACLQTSLRAGRLVFSLAEDPGKQLLGFICSWQWPSSSFTASLPAEASATS